MPKRSKLAWCGVYGATVQPWASPRSTWNTSAVSASSTQAVPLRSTAIENGVSAPSQSSVRT
jgi:hypothetical protein